MIGGVGVAEAMVGILAGTISVAVVSFKLGSWKNEIESDHEEMKDAHNMIHEDIEKIVNHLNGYDTSSRENCAVCQEVEDSD